MVNPGDKSPTPDITPEQINDAVEHMVPQLQANIAKIAAFESDVEPHLRLRDSFCGPVSAAVSEKLTADGIPAHPIVGDISDVATKYPGVQRRHVLTITESDTAPVIIDATYGQHFRPFGLSMWFVHDKLKTDDPYPHNQVLVLPKSEVADTAEVMANFVEHFWDKYRESKEFRDFWRHVPEQIMTGASHDQLVEYFTAVWDISRYERFDINPKNRLLVERLLEEP